MKKLIYNLYIVNDLSLIIIYIHNMNSQNSNMNNTTNTTTDITNKPDTDDLVQILINSESIMLSIVIISKGLINSHHSNLESKENIAVLNITHTDSYTQDLKNRIENMYELLGARYIFPLCIWKNNLEITKQSTGNINRHIYNDIDQMCNFKVNIMIDTIKQNIPKHNYVVQYKIIESLTQGLKDMGLEPVYLSEWIDCIKSNNFNKLTKYIEKKYKIKNIIVLQNINNGLDKNQIQYLRQYGIEQQKNKYNNRKRKITNITDLEPNVLQVEQTNLNNIIELDSFELNFDLL